MVGKLVKVICEPVPQAFGVPAQVKEQVGDTLLLDVDGIFHTVQVKESQVEIQPPLRLVMAAPGLQINKQEKIELHVKFPMLDTLVMAERCTGEHIMLGNWVLDRDVFWDMGGAWLAPPHVVQMLYAACTEEGGSPDDVADRDLALKKAVQVITARWKESGLVGFPIWGANGGGGSEHWTLMVWKLQGAVSVRYYDSCKGEMPKDNLKVAKLLLTKFEFPDEIEKSNKRSHQTNGVDCGVFALHFWECEVRQFIGFGWCGEFPQTGGNIKKRK